MSFRCTKCGSESFYTHGTEEVIWYVDDRGDVIETGDIVDGNLTDGWSYRCENCDTEYSQIPPKENKEEEWLAVQKNRYLREEGMMCPICESDDIASQDSTEFDGITAWQDVKCNNCEAEWSDIFYLRGIEIHSYPDGYAPKKKSVNPNEAFKKKRADNE